MANTTIPITPRGPAVGVTPVNQDQQFGFSDGSVYRYVGAGRGQVGLNNEAIQTGAPVTPTAPVPTPPPAISRPTIAPIDENAIRESTRQRMQTSIDAINAQYANLISQENVAGADRSGQTRAVNARSGLMGSDFGQAQTEKTTQFNKSQVQALESEKAAQINAVMMNIEDRASAEIKAKKDEALQRYQIDSGEYQKAQEQARGDLEQLAKSGVALESLNPAQKAALFKQAGYEDPNFGEIVYNAMKPKAQQIDYKFEKLADGQGLFYGIDPTTGQLVTKNVKVDLPDGFTMTIAPDGTPLVFNKNTGEAKIARGFGQGDLAKPEDALDVQKKKLEIQKLQNEISGNGDLLPTEKDRAAFNQIVSKYNSSPLIAAADRTIVLKNTADAVRKNPGDAALQLNLAYGYIQALDTYQSSVREGELGNVNSIDSKIGQLQNSISQLTSGQTVRPEIAKQIADAADNLVKYISEGAQRKEQVFESQAKVNGIDGAWKSFRSGFTTNYDNGQSNGIDLNDPQVKTLHDAGFTPEEINAALGKTSVGGDTNPAPKPGDKTFVGPVFSSIKLGSPLAKANNNPGNLRYVGQAGAKQGKGGFAAFSTPEAGVKALSSQIKLDTSRGHTLASFINKYAPPVENNTSVYLQQAAKALGVSPSTKLASIDHNALLRFMAKKESSTIIA